MVIISPEIVKSMGLSRPERPKDIRIILSVCSCYKNERLILIIERADRITSILGITLQQLECAAVTAMITGKPEVVACYKQGDIAEAKLSQLEAITPFIARSCHSFSLVSES